MSDTVLNYQIVGTGPPLLMVHGFGISFEIWKSITPLLYSYFSLIIVELPGIGGSPMPDPQEPYIDQAVAWLENTRKLLGVKRWQICSYSSGTFVATKYAQLYPVHVQGSIFLCPVQVSPLRAFGLSLALRIDKTFHQFGDWVLSGARLKFLIDLLGFNLTKNELSISWFKEISSQPVEILKRTLESLLVQDAMTITPPDKVPLAIIWGDKDLLAKLPYKSLRQCDHLIHAFHCAPQTAAQQIVEIALPFLLSNCRNS